MVDILLAAYSVLWEAVAAEYGTNQQYPRQLFYINAVLLHTVFNRFVLTIALGTGIFTLYGLLYSFVKEFQRKWTKSSRFICGSDGYSI